MQNVLRNKSFASSLSLSVFNIIFQRFAIRILNRSNFFESKDSFFPKAKIYTSLYTRNTLDPRSRTNAERKGQIEGSRRGQKFIPVSWEASERFYSIFNRRCSIRLIVITNVYPASNSRSFEGERMRDTKRLGERFTRQTLNVTYRVFSLFQERHLQHKPARPNGDRRSGEWNV